MAASQVPWGVQALDGTVTTPAWKSKPSWYLVATSDKMIPPPAQRSMSKRAGATTVEVEGSHAVYVSRPEAVAQLIERAAKSLDRSPRLPLAPRKRILRGQGAETFVRGALV